MLREPSRIGPRALTATRLLPRTSPTATATCPERVVSITRSDGGLCRLLTHGVGQREHREILGLETGPPDPVLIDRDLGESGHDRSLHRRLGQSPEVVPVGHHDHVLKNQGDREGQRHRGARCRDANPVGCHR